MVRDDVVQRLTVRVDLARLDRAVELRPVAADRLHLLLELVADVHDEGGPDEVLPIRERSAGSCAAGASARRARSSRGRRRSTRRARAARRRGGRDGVPRSAGAMTTRGRKRRMARASSSRVAGVFSIPASGRPSVSRALQPRISAARAASSPRSAAEPRVPISPCVRSMIAVRWPRRRRLDQRAAAGELDVVAVRGDGEDGDGRRSAWAEYGRELRIGRLTARLRAGSSVDGLSVHRGRRDAAIPEARREPRNRHATTSRRLLVPQRHHRIQPRRRDRRQHAEHDARHRADAERGGDAAPRRRGRDRRPRRPHADRDEDAERRDRPRRRCR